ncbi:hypothetical protein LTR36_004307 [Oleoguttula mirabilis]|uniref:Fe2OG dioxygenase domain-containing protein n=1 Tax=Oleoguttula mirabilis TaxID=1507867 RepID=A0AAV9JH25_9PEZI|nr:hypothetical protein LTR36_004307 [Oleoguttula mirabilis]
MAFPVIDISRIDDPEAQLDIALKITEASRTWGFLLLKNHPIPNEDVDAMFQLGRDFFNLPPAGKDSWPINDKYMGYNAPLSDRRKDDKASMWLAGKPGQLQNSLDALPPFWHAHIDEVEAFKHACHALVVKLLVCFALAMELPDRNFFAKAHGEAEGDGNQLRILSYPARGNAPADKITRMSPHSDSGSVTLLFQTCAGLEVESPSGEWMPAPHLDDHILVNLGDALAFWSGGRLRATKHRVTFGTVPHDVERISMAYFGAASHDTVLQPLKQEEGGEAQVLRDYNANGVVIQPGVTVGEYLKVIMNNIYGNGAMHQLVVETPKAHGIAV